MATYKYGQFLTKIDHTAFDDLSTPGTAAPFLVSTDAKAAAARLPQTKASRCHHKILINTALAKAI